MNKTETTGPTASDDAPEIDTQGRLLIRVVGWWSKDKPLQDDGFQEGETERIEVFLSPCAPRIGDRYAVQYWECEVYKVVWSYARVDG